MNNKSRKDKIEKIDKFYGIIRNDIGGQPVYNDVKESIEVIVLKINQIIDKLN